MSKQIEFFRQVGGELELNSEQVGKLIGMSGRNYRDWMAGKLLPRKDIMQKLSELSGVKIPEIIGEREEWWSGRVNGANAAMICFQKHGVPGTIEDRRKGGRNSQINRRLDPVYYRALGCKVASEFIVPKYSCALAEFVGIVLGDGGITKDQCQISLHMVDDAEYAEHVRGLAKKLFNSNSSISAYSRNNVIKVVISGVKFVEILELFGLRRGNKIKHQVDIPGWIKRKQSYLRACMRGLYDTDGGTYTHNHIVNGHRYLHFGITFTSASVPLINSYKRGLIQNGFEIHGSGGNVFLYGVKASQRFFDVFRPNNPKSRARLAKYVAEVVRVK